MSQLIIARPASSEHAPYYSRYIDLVKGDDILQILAGQIETTLAHLRTIPNAKGDYRYALGKWNIKEVVRHMLDAERVFAFRALWFARRGAGSLPGLEQDDWIKASALEEVELDELTAELETVRQSTLLFFRHLTAEEWTRRGTASNLEFTVRAVGYIIAGHELHHLEVLKTRYP